MLQGATYKGITIEDDCWLGCGVKVLDGVTIGRGSVIGAGSVVTKNIPPTRSRLAYLLKWFPGEKTF
uniref:DapH/DapD/GlmU-related protein n=1 Tax=Desertifilum tharense IPPAS B-1220 TaxID=1781255 RepID=A0ACD5GX85_9CYAN